MIERIAEAINPTVRGWMNYFGAYNKSAIDNSSLQPWERVSAAVGCAVYDPATDDGVGTVLARADGAMYENKRAMKENAVFLVNENVEHVRAL